MSKSKKKSSKKSNVSDINKNKTVVIELLPAEFEAARIAAESNGLEIHESMRIELGLSRTPAEPKSVKVDGLKANEIEEILNEIECRPSKVLSAGVLGVFNRLRPEETIQAATRALGYPVSSLELKYDGNGDKIVKEASDEDAGSNG